MKIIHLKSELPYGPIQSWSGKTPPSGCVEIPEDFVIVYNNPEKRSYGFVNITHDGTTVTSCEWNEEAYQQWCEENPEPDTLSENKAARIQQSKTDLETYLSEHPIQWTDGEYYSITQEKQNQLTSKLAVAQAKATMGVPYELKWNTTAEVCIPWEISDLYALAFAIDGRVTALVTYQQEQEVAMRSAQTQEELDAIEVDYDSVQ